MYGLKERLRQGERLLGTMVTTFASVDMALLLKRCGFDYFIIDCEHGSFTTREVANMLALARAEKLPALVRIPELRREHVLKYLEMAAAGILLPCTENAEAARALVNFGKYAPDGDRGVSLSRPHTGFRKLEPASYMTEANRETIFMCQIESRKGVENITEIVAVSGVDGVLLGPNDLSQNLGMPDQYMAPEMLAAFDAVLQAGQKAGKFVGAHFSAELPLKHWIQRGMTLNLWSSDAGLMLLGAQGGISRLRQTLADAEPAAN